MSLYENLCAACEKRGISLTRLIVESGFASSNIARLKTGSMPSYEMVEAMARRLNMSIDELVYGEKNLVVLNEQERERISAYGRGNVFILDDEEKELLSIYRSVPAGKRSMCKDFLKTHLVPDVQADAQEESKE